MCPALPHVLHGFWFIYSSLKSIANVCYLRSSSRHTQLVGWGWGRPQAHASGCVPRPSNGSSQATVVTFLLSFSPALSNGSLTSWIPGSQVGVIFERFLPLPCCHRSLARWKVSHAHPFFPMSTASILTQAFIIFMKFQCPSRFIFLPVKLIHYRQPRTTKSKIKSSVPLNNHGLYFGVFSSIPFLCLSIFTSSWDPAAHVSSLWVSAT